MKRQEWIDRTLLQWAEAIARIGENPSWAIVAEIYQELAYTESIKGETECPN